MASLKALLAPNRKATPEQTATPPAAQGVVIRKSAEGLSSEASAAPVTSPEPPRAIGEPAFDVPFEFPSDKNSEGARQWLGLRQLPETCLGIWIEPGMEHAWIAIRNNRHPEEKPLLISRLPVLTISKDDPY